MARTSPFTSAAFTFVAAVAVVASLALSLPAEAQQSDEAADWDALTAEGLVRLDEIEAGALLFKTDEPGWYVPAPVLDTDIDIAVSGPLARTIVSQRFRNVANVFVDGKYVFPLDEGAAVDTLRMRVGDRWIEGSIAEREEARIIFEEAAAAGQVASLVEQERPNVFTTSVANIAPGADVLIQIEYQQTLAPRDGTFGLRVPLVVAPRYTPDRPIIRELTLTDSGWVITTEPGSSRTSVSPPNVITGGDDNNIRNPVDISIDLDAGFPLGLIDSYYHGIDVQPRNESAARISLNGPVPADRDFYLSWQPAELAGPYAALFAEARPDQTHFITMLTPPSPGAIRETSAPREVIFVQDTSGSMDGDSIEQAKAGLSMALERLTPEDEFNIVEFDSFFTTFATRPVKATGRNIERALAFVDGLVADEGTEMLAALEYALDDRDPDDGLLRQVVFLTDGNVTNELQMLDLIERGLGDSRLFTVGIGSAPNSYFMTAAARSGRGSFVFIGDIAEVSERMQNLFAKLETPAVTGLSVDGLPDGATITPFPIPDLYAGDPVVLTVRTPNDAATGSLLLTGRRGADRWSLDLALADAEIRPGVSRLWAREQIRDLEALRISPLADAELLAKIDQAVLETALEFSLVSRVTSLVAVDLEVTRPPDVDSVETDVRTNLPDGWNPDFFVEAPAEEEAAGADELSMVAHKRLKAAASQPEPGTGRPSAPIPVGGADWQLRAMLGLGLMATGVVAFVVTGDRRRRW